MKKEIATIGMIAILIVSAFTLAIPVSAAPTADSFGVTNAAGDSGTQVDVPVTITNAQTGPIISILFDISYDNNGYMYKKLTPKVSQYCINKKYDCYWNDLGNGRYEWLGPNTQRVNFRMHGVAAPGSGGNNYVDINNVVDKHGLLVTAGIEPGCDPVVDKFNPWSNTIPDNNNRVHTKTTVAIIMEIYK